MFPGQSYSKGGGQNRNSGSGPQASTGERCHLSGAPGQGVNLQALSGLLQDGVGATAGSSNNSQLGQPRAQAATTNHGNQGVNSAPVALQGLSLSSDQAPHHRNNSHGGEPPRIYSNNMAGRGNTSGNHSDPYRGGGRGRGRGGNDNYSYDRGSGRGRGGNAYYDRGADRGRGGYQQNNGGRGGGFGRGFGNYQNAPDRGRGGRGGAPQYGKNAYNGDTKGDWVRKLQSNASGGGANQSAVPDTLPGGQDVARADPNNMETWTAKEYHSFVKAFVDNDAADTLSFPPTLTAHQRHEVHLAASHFNLHHRSTGPKESRQLTLTKDIKNTTVKDSSELQILDGNRVKTYEGYQGAQPLPDMFVGDKAEEITTLVRPLRQNMLRSIRNEALRPSRNELHRGIGQPGLSTVPKSTVPKQRYQELVEFRRSLPSTKSIPDLINALKTNDVVVVSGDTGCGKTTQLPQALYDANIFPKNSLVVCTQPRRISAVSVAHRVAEERGEACGDSCGYIVRFENVTSSNTKILYMTTGILLRWMHSSKNLPGVSCVIVDEAHERDVETDFVLLLLRDRMMQETKTKGGSALKVIVMSATIQIDRFQHYMKAANGGRNPALISIPGTLYPVDEFFLDDALAWMNLPASAVPAFNMIKRTTTEQSSATDAEANASSATGGANEEDAGAGADEDGKWSMYHKLKDTVFYEANQEPEAMVPYNVVLKLIERFHNTSTNLKEGILVFLPGWAAIDRVISGLKRTPLVKTLSILGLHSSLTTQEQRRVFFPPPRGFRKVVLATNIAETSITIDDIVFVIDCCLLKGTSYDPAGNTSSLKASYISKANGIQRRGRAGRCQKGVCVHLLQKSVYNDLPDFLPPQIVRTPLEEVCLQAKAIQSNESCVDILSRALDAPPKDAILHAVDFLKEVGALDNRETLTNVGRALSKLPVHPLLGKMLFVATCLGVLEPVAAIAAALSTKSPFVKPMPHQRQQARKVLQDLDNNQLSDHLCVLRLVQGWKASHRSPDYAMQRLADNTTLRNIERVQQQLIHLVTHSTSLLKSCGNSVDHASRYSDNVGLIRFAVLWALFPRVGTIEYRKNRDKNRANAICWDNKHAQFPPSSVLFKCNRGDYLDNVFFFYYERMLLESNLSIFEATVVTTCEVALCMNVLDIIPLKDLPMAMRIDEEGTLGPPNEYEEVENPSEDATALLFDGDKKLYVTKKNTATAIGMVRDCMDYYLALSVKRISAALFPEDLIRAIGLTIGFPANQKTTKTATVAYVDEDGEVQPDENATQRNLPAFVRGTYGYDTSDTDVSSDDGGPMIVEEDEEEELELTEEQKERVTAAFGELSILRSTAKRSSIRLIPSAVGKSAGETPANPEQPAA